MRVTVRFPRIGDNLPKYLSQDRPLTRTSHPVRALNITMAHLLT